MFLYVIFYALGEKLERDGMTCGNDKIDLINKLNVNVGFFTVENSNLMFIFHTILVTNSNMVMSSKWSMMDKDSLPLD
jgi:hypothetical protein